MIKNIINKQKDKKKRIKEKYSEKEINKLKDELDVANAKVISLSQAEKTLQQYKRRVETLSSVKIKLKEVEKLNENLKEQLEIKEIETENTNSLKRNIKVLRKLK